jgi:hypothetical protein
MGDKNLIFLIIVFLGLLVFIVLLSPSTPDPPPKTVLTMTMVPVDNSPGEFILEYSSGKKELLKADGTRIPIQ